MQTAHLVSHIILLVITRLGQSRGELCPQRLHLLVGLEQRLSAIQLHHHNVHTGYFTPLSMPSIALPPSLVACAFEVQDGFGGRLGPSDVSSRASDNTKAHGFRLNVSKAPISSACSCTERDRGELLRPPFISLCLIRKEIERIAE